MSSPTVTHTDAPQESVLSPVLFTLYAHKCRAGSSDVFSVKFTDDMVIVGPQELWSEGHRCLSGRQLQNPLVEARSEGYHQAEEDFRAWLAQESAEPPDRYRLTRRAEARTVTEGKNPDV